MEIVLHLAVHLVGVAVAVALALLVVLRPQHGAPIVPSSARPAILVGAILLATSHLVVGGLLAPADGWPLLLRAGGYAAIALGAAGGVVAASPVVALLPGTLPLTAAFAGAAAAVATAVGVFGRGGRVALLSGGLVLYALGDLVVAQRPVLAAGLSLGGSAAAGTWLLRRAGRRSLAGRVTGASLVLLLVAVLGVAAGSGLVLTADVAAEQRSRLTAVAAAQAGDVTDRAGAALEATASALAGATLADPIEDGDVALAARRVEGITGLPEIDTVVLTDVDGQVVATTRRDGTLLPAGILAVAGSPVVERALDGQLARGVVDLGDGTLLAVGASPVAPTGEDGRPLVLRQAGTLVLGRTITSIPTVERLADDTAADVAIVVGGRTVVATDALADLDPATLDGDTADVGGTARQVATAPLGDPARGQLVLALPADIVADAADTATRSTFLLALVGLLLVGGAATVLGRRIARPVTDLTVVAEQVAAGDLHAEVARPRGDDEVARLTEAFGGMTTSLAARDADLRGSLRQQAALRDELEAVTASMGEALLATDPTGCIVTANRAAAELLDPDGDGLVGRPLADVLSGRAESGTDLVEALGVAGDGAVTRRGELARSGRIVEVSAAPLAVPSGDRSGGRVHVVRDITDRVIADRVRTEVIANLSHELNTPLTPIKAFLELLAARGGVDPRYEPMLELAREGRERLERTIGALVDLAELEAGRRVVVDGPVDLREVVGALVERWRDRAPDRHITRRLERGLPAVTGDGDLLGRVLDEVVDNALKFSAGPVRVTGRQVLLDGNAAVELCVHDRGPGIPTDRRREVLELFVQADGSATRSVGGLGIGLPLAHRMVQACGGSLRLTEAPGGGTDVLITLPAAPGGEPTAAALDLTDRGAPHDDAQDRDDRSERDASAGGRPWVTVGGGTP